jgi:hypothetical protein
VMVHICNPSYLGCESRRTVVQGQPWQKLARSCLKKKPGVMVSRSCSSNYSGGRSRRITVWGKPQQKLKTLSEKQTKSKRLMIWLEHLPSKLEALSTIPNKPSCPQRKE